MKWIYSTLLFFSVIATADTSLPKLKDDQGYYVLAYSGNYPPYYLSIGTREVFPSYETFKEFKSTDGYRIIVMEEGEYTLSRIKLTSGSRYYKLRDYEFDFNIEAGKINYSGHFIYNYLHNNRRLSSSVENHITHTYQWLNQQHSKLLKTHELKYIGLGKDDFMSFYAHE